ncbi:MAG: hypothetical protein MZV64_58785 [Ignavibacteriales bacterium]|nr:hypothetical protein [Ignavibacteriales bacterium]
MNYVSPDILKMPKEVMDEVGAKGIPQAEFSIARKSPARNRRAVRHPRPEGTLRRPRRL